MKRFLLIASLLQLAVGVPQNFNRDQPNNSGSFLPTTFSGNMNSSGSTDFRRNEGFSNLQPTDSFGRTNQPTDSFGRNNQPTDSFGRNNQPTDNFGRNNQPTDNFGRNNQPTDNFRGSTDNFRGSNEPTDNFGGTHFDDNSRRNFTSTENMFGITPTTDGYRTSNRHDIYQYDHTESGNRANERRPNQDQNRYGGKSDSSIASLSFSMSCFLVGAYCILSHL